MSDAEIHAATAAEDFLADRPGMAVGIVAGIALGKGNADLHRPTGTHRVQVAQQCAAQGDSADKVIENRTELLFAAHGVEPFAVALAVG
ncbi:hypothetical protein D3C84_912720 [compost metagenome]